MIEYLAYLNTIISCSIACTSCEGFCTMTLGFGGGAGLTSGIFCKAIFNSETERRIKVVIYIGSEQYIDLICQQSE